MAIHASPESMLVESLREYFFVAEMCIQSRKDPQQFGTGAEYGCYGYPAGLLLLSIADCIGSYVLKGNNFNILRESKYYNLPLSEKDVKIIDEYYRNSLVHNGLLIPGVALEIGSDTDAVYLVRHDGMPTLRLTPFLNATRIALETFFKENLPSLKDSKTMKRIKDKSDYLDR